jgi:hypothetical protein
MIRVGQRQMRKAYPQATGYIQIAAWSGGKKPYNDLSPFFLGPLQLDQLTAQNFENAWQYSKVYACHVDQNGDPTPQWEQWRQNGFAQKKADRHPMKGEKPLYCYYKGQKLDVVEARKQIYIPFYKELVRKTKTYQLLLSMLKNGHNLLIIEPDGPDLQKFPEGVQFDRDLFKKLISITDQKSFHDCLNLTFSGDNRYFALGHGYVLCDALLEDL